jgi:hypothetical protein
VDYFFSSALLTLVSGPEKRFQPKCFEKNCWKNKMCAYLCASSLNITYQERQRDMAR